MPYTPYHWGPASWIGLFFFKVFDIPTLMVASVIVDVEPFCAMYLGFDIPMHGICHTFLGASVFAIAIAVAMCYLQKPIQKIMTLLKLKQNSSIKVILFTALFGTYFHIFLDALIYNDMNPFYPIKGNPIVGFVSGIHVYSFCRWSFLFGAIMYVIRLVITSRRNNNADSRTVAQEKNP